MLVVAGPDGESAGRSIVLTSHATLTLGREEGAEGRTFVLPDSQVSRRHAEVSQTGGTWTLRDLESRNGTFVNGERVDTAALTASDILRVGAHVLLVQEVGVDEVAALLTPHAESALIGESIVTARLRAQIERLGKLELPVLVIGESGVGKEVVARELHEARGRGGPLVTVNCAALPEQLAESELFGHAKGAFTGADRASKGLFGEADGGSIFLDEIGEMPAALQAKLLRTLATGEVRPVGESTTWSPDVRVVAATNVDLERAIEDGSFRGDLYARMMGAVIEIPPLRERPADTLPLARAFLRSAAGHDDITPDAAEALLLTPWRFNVRELEQTIRVSGASLNGALDLDDLPERMRATVEARDSDEPDGSSDAAGAFSELELLEIARDATPDAATLGRVLSHYEGNISKTARFFGRSRRQIHRWAEKLDVHVDSDN